MKLWVGCGCEGGEGEGLGAREVKGEGLGMGAREVRGEA